MAHKIEFTKPDSINGKPYGKGDTESVSLSILNSLKKNGTVKEIKSKKEK